MNIEGEIYRRVLGATEAALIERVEEIEGRVPSDQEIARYGHKFLYPNGVEEWTWKGQLIVRVEPPIWMDPSVVKAFLIRKF